MTVTLRQALSGRTASKTAGKPPRVLRERAMEYAAHGWPVAPLAVVFPGQDCPCGAGCRQTHLAGGEITDPDDARAAWGDHGWGIAVITSRFDVLDLPGAYGAEIHYRLLTKCPSATARPGRRFDVMWEPGPVRWHLYLTPGQVDPAKVTAVGGVLHSGPDDWIAIAPTRTPQTGRVGWVVPPMQASWRPYRRMDIFDQLDLA